MLFHLTYMVDGAQSRFDLLTAAQRHAVREFLLFRLSVPHWQFVHPMIEAALREYWIERPFRAP